MTLDELLGNLDACAQALNWAKGKTLAEAWATCQRGDWMLWLAGKMADATGWPTRKQVSLAACDCASLALPYAGENREVAEKAIEMTRAWTRGEASLDEVRAAANAANAANAAYAATAAVATNATYATYATNAAYDARGKCKKMLAQCADIARRMLTVPVIEEAA